MLSWTAWKERLSWLRNRVAKVLKFAARPLIATITVLAILCFVVVTYRTWPYAWDWLQGGNNGQIVVNSPTVYTRQRLVNDRLLQTAWLQDQLNAADKDFRSVDQLYRRNETWQTTVRSGSQAADSAGKTNPQSAQRGIDQNGKSTEPISTEPLSVNPTTPAQFRAKNLYREEVRAEITQTQLDDRHDISGNTIYRLAFDATVIPGSRRDAVVGIRITLSHKVLKTEAEAEADKKNPDRKAYDILYQQDYDSLYSEWISHMQTQVTTSIENISSEITSSNAGSTGNQRLARFLLQAICRHKIQIETGKDGDSYCNPKALTAARDFVAKLTKAHSSIRESQSRADFKRYLENILGNERVYQGVRGPRQALWRRDNSARINRYYEAARLYCRRDNLPTFELTIFSDLKPLFRAGQSPTMACPYNDTPSERLRLTVLVYDELLRLKRENPDKLLPDIEKLENDDNKLKKFDTCPNKDNPAEDQTLCWYNQLQAAARCFAVDFIEADLNRFPAIFKNEPWKKIDYFLTLEKTDRETGECNALVSASRYPSKTIEELKYILNSNTETFAYSVTPKNFTENISTASETRDAFELMARYGLAAGGNVGGMASQLIERSAQMRAILANPVVVGFSSGTKKPEVIHHPHREENDEFYHELNPGRQTTAVRHVEVGWIIAPRVRDRKLAQIDNQYALTTVISVPSWWRSVELDMEACWIPRERLSEIKPEADGTLEICEGFEKLPKKKSVVRLPGPVAELSRKFGIDVLREPALYARDNSTQVLEIGQPGWLLLRGARLWRSTEVTLGSQKADTIVVLPNMDGIIASFKCVQPQLTYTGYDGQPIRSNAFVWTSEGVTAPAPVVLVWPPAASRPTTPTTPPSVDSPAAAEAVLSFPTGPSDSVSSTAAAGDASASSKRRDTQPLNPGEIRWCPPARATAQ